MGKFNNYRRYILHKQKISQLVSITQHTKKIFEKYLNTWETKKGEETRLWILKEI